MRNDQFAIVLVVTILAGLYAFLFSRSPDEHAIDADPTLFCESWYC